MNFFHDVQQMREAGVTASILAVGDSWFWYPSFGGSLVNYLGPMVAPAHHNILAVGNNGAEVADFTVGKYKRRLREAIRLYGKSLSAVWISAGGNDFAGPEDLGRLLNQDCSAAGSASECFRKGPEGLNGFLKAIDNHYRNLLGQIWTRTGPHCHVFVHGYDYALPTGRGFAGIGRAWLKPALDAAQVPTALQAPCVVYLVDQFHRVLNGVVATDPGHFHLVDSRGVLEAKHWANELHPTGAGFKRIAQVAWLPALKSHGFAP